MVRILRAFIWMRWRTLANSIERRGSRDSLERFSIALEQLGPILAAILLVPSVLMLSALGGAAGFSLARGDADAITLQAARYLLLLLPAIVIVGPILMPGSARVNPTRLLLLPIPRSTLYLAHTASTLGEPWNFLAAPLIIFLAAGLLVGGAAVAAILTFVSGLLLIVVLLGAGALVTSGLHLLFRDRRRGELVALLFIVLIPLASLVPAFLDPDLRRERASSGDGVKVPGWIERSARTAFHLLPPQMYLTTATNAAGRSLAPSGANLAGLAAMGALVHFAGFAMFRRVLDSPASSGGRRTGRMRTVWTRRVPLLSPGASAVALAQFRLALRTPRGRSILLSPLMLFMFFGFLTLSEAEGLELGPFRSRGGLGLAAVTSYFCMLSVLPIAMNQFAVDRAGLTLTLLSPLTEMELLVGKAVGNALIGLGPSLFCYIAALSLLPGGPLSLWVGIPVGLFATFVLVAPIAAILSATFPKSADLNTIGGNNAHGLAALIGMVAFAAAAVPPVLLALLAVGLFQRPALAPVLVASWSVVAFLISRYLFSVARRVFHRRRENLAMLE